MNKVNKIMSKYLSFILGEEEYCVSIDFVKEIIVASRITKVPKMPNEVAGVLNLRGKIIPVINIKHKFGFDNKTPGSKSSIIIVELEYNSRPELFGIVVDYTKEVLHIPDEEMSSIPYINARINANYITGVADMNGRIIIGLDMNKVLNEEDLELLNTVSTSTGIFSQTPPAE